jgi:hypothetical protein
LFVFSDLVPSIFYLILPLYLCRSFSLVFRIVLLNFFCLVPLFLYIFDILCLYLMRTI